MYDEIEIRKLNTHMSLFIKEKQKTHFKHFKCILTNQKRKYIETAKKVSYCKFSSHNHPTNLAPKSLYASRDK